MWLFTNQTSFHFVIDYLWHFLLFLSAIGLASHVLPRTIVWWNMIHDLILFSWYPHGVNTLQNIQWQNIQRNHNPIEWKRIEFKEKAMPLWQTNTSFRDVKKCEWSNESTNSHWTETDAKPKQQQQQKSCRKVKSHLRNSSLQTNSKTNQCYYDVVKIKNRDQ